LFQSNPFVTSASAFAQLGKDDLGAGCQVGLTAVKVGQGGLGILADTDAVAALENSARLNALPCGLIRRSDLDEAGCLDDSGCGWRESAGPKHKACDPHNQ
jgi:hypothetical protein